MPKTQSKFSRLAENRKVLHAVIFCVLLVLLSGFFWFRVNYHEGKIGNNATPALSPSSENNTQRDGFVLLIPKLNIEVPVIPNVEGNDKKSYDQALEGGVAHLKGSALPGEGSNIFIFGHSSFYWFSPGDYKEVFKPLDKVEIGDEITLWYDQQEYDYFVSEKKIVSPNSVENIKPTQEEQVTLMTCYPPGTTSKRLIVVAKLH